MSEWTFNTALKITHYRRVYLVKCSFFIVLDNASDIVFFLILDLPFLSELLSANEIFILVDLKCCLAEMQEGKELSI